MHTRSRVSVCFSGDTNGGTVSAAHCLPFPPLPTFLSRPRTRTRTSTCAHARTRRYKNVTLLHRINAWEIPAQFPGQVFDGIIWNHPHLGVEDFRLHRFLMAHFFHSAATALKPDGFISVSLVRGQETRWELLGQAARAGWSPFPVVSAFSTAVHFSLHSVSPLVPYLSSVDESLTPITITPTPPHHPHTYRHRHRHRHRHRNRSQSGVAVVQPLR